VFAKIAERAAQLTTADWSAVSLLDGEIIRLAALHNMTDNKVVDELNQFFPRSIDKTSMLAQVYRTRAPVHYYDLQTAPSDAAPALIRSSRSALAVPMLEGGKVIGTVGVASSAPHAFGPRQIDLLKTFADQAVIAISNMNLFAEVQARTKELQESLEYQTATADVLGVISKSPNQLQPVLDAIVKTAFRLCPSDRALIMLPDPAGYRVVARAGPAPQQIAERMQGPMRVDRGSIFGRVALEGHTIHVEDVRADPDYKLLRGLSVDDRRTTLGVPLVREGNVTGVILLLRTVVEPYSQRQIELVETFADQAVIAMNNARLFEEVQTRNVELRMSLEQQTATSELLKVIGRSTFQLQPVFDALAENAIKLCSAERAFVHRFDGRALRVVATNNVSPELRTFVEEHPIAPGRHSVAARAALDRRSFSISDVQADPELTFAGRDVEPVRSALSVPMLRGDELLGVIMIYRHEVRPFSDSQVALMETFADQAAIAIENTRLFEAEQASKRELQESLEYQTATSDVLGVISRSKFDLRPVLDSIVQTAARLCACDMATIRRREGDVYVQLGGYGLPTDYADYSRTTNWHHAGRGSLVGRVLQEGKAIQIVDALTDPEYTLDEVQRRGGFRTMLGVPLLRGEDQVGIIVLMRRAVQPFSDRQIELVTAFADQAVIAIENTRLFEEVQERTRELAKTVEDLEIASQHKSQFVANMSHELRTPLAAILGYAELMQEGFYGEPSPKSMDALTRIRSNGKHLLGLINTVLDIAKIESGQFTLNMAEYAIESVVETVRSATESLAQNKKLTLKTDVAKSMPFGIGDEQRLTQVLLNLVGNAIKFTDAGEVRVSAVAANGAFAVSVADTGPGIPPDQLTRVFEQFHQVDSSNTKAKGGTGLGLAISKQIVEMHGGRIWVESTLGKGSVFHMELPTRAEFRKVAP
jgi:signal transduction histidine kinase/putative methionine-R-sulfoxide reductase with GAF domain